mgnify:CR=1 FL=1
MICSALLPLSGIKPPPSATVPAGTAKVGSCWFGVPPLLPLLIPAPAGGCPPATNRTGEAFTADGEVIALSGGEGGAANACFTCHGLDGLGDGVSVPRLAGLDAGYLQKQLVDYATETPRDEVMGPGARWVAHSDQLAVPRGYPALPVAPPKAPAGPPPTIWLNGAPERGVIACASCHGADGLGVGQGNPAVAGQPAAYTVDQLRRWKRGERRNDPRGVMAVAASGLSEAELHAIAVWLERAPIAPRPASAAASGSAGAAAAARSAASRGKHRPDR